MDLLRSTGGDIGLAAHKSPFWKKTYGGYTPPQVEYIAEAATRESLRSFYDPMSGQGYSTCQIAWFGADVHLSDINPGPLCLAALRAPRLLVQRERLTNSLKQLLTDVISRRTRRPKISYCSGWIAESTTVELRTLFDDLGVDLSRDPFSAGEKFWSQPSRDLLIICLSVLACRGLTCYRETDNRTWLRKGGVTPEISCAKALLEAIGSWDRFAQQICANKREFGSLAISTWDISSGPNPHVPEVDMLVVSPPYANRLDYSSLWAPEVALLSALFPGHEADVKLRQVGTVVVKGNRPTPTAIRKLPPVVRRVLQAMQGHDSYASARYYHPYFANYAITLRESVANWVSHTKAGGEVLAFVRDTVRKDQVFPTDLLVKEVARSAGLKYLSKESREVTIRSHIGFVRKRNAALAVRGLAQNEFWLKFKRE